MDEPIISQDGNWLWDGDNWVPVSNNQQTIDSFKNLYELSRNTVLLMDYQLTLKYQFQMKEMGELNEDPLQIYWARVLLGNTSIIFEGDTVFQYLDEFEKIGHHALLIAREHNNIQMQIDAQNLLGGVQAKKRNWTIALQYQLDALFLCNELGEINEIVSAHLSLSMIYSMLHKYDEAKSHLAIANNLFDALSTISLLELSIDTLKIGILMKKHNKSFASLSPPIQNEIMEIGIQYISRLNNYKIPNLGVDNLILEVERLFEIIEPPVQIIPKGGPPSSKLNGFGIVATITAGLIGIVVICAKILQFAYFLQAGGKGR
jgi:tetratricopeptide (TPR) repeat protein